MSDAAPRDRVTIQLDRDLALSFFEWSYQFMTDHNPTFQHPADAIAVDQISSELERSLAEPFRAEYSQLLAEARARALKRYEDHMGEKHASWLKTLEYQQLGSSGGQQSNGSNISRTERQLSRESVQEFALCDAALIGIRWSADRRDLSLNLRLGDGREATLSCRWAVGVRIQLGANSQELGGPLSWECRWEQADGRWRMSMDFASRGAVELDCQGAVLVYDAG